MSTTSGDFFRNTAEAVAQVSNGIKGQIKEHFSVVAAQAWATTSAEFRQDFNTTDQNNLEPLAFITIYFIQNGLAQIRTLIHRCFRHFKGRKGDNSVMTCPRSHRRFLEWKFV